MARPKWYQRKEFKQPCEMELGDRSVVKVMQVDEQTLLAIRSYLGGESERVRTTMDTKGVFHYEVADRDRFGVAKAFIGDPDWHPPFVYSNPIPGTSPSSIETYHEGTRMDHGTRKKFDEYFEKKGLALAQKSDLINMHERTPPKSTHKPDGGALGRFTGGVPGKPAGATRTVVLDDLRKVQDA